MITYVKTLCILAGGVVLAVVFALAMSPAISTVASAKPEFSAQIGKPCGQCHQNPAGGGKLKPYGDKFKANGFKAPK